MPPALLSFAEHFNRGEFWHSHEVLEAPWRRYRSEFYKGLILYASAWVHVQRGNARGVRAQLRKAERSLGRYRPVYLGVDVEALLAHGAATLRRIGAWESGSDSAAWESLARPRLELDSARLSGAEEELGYGEG